jgi:hypothetical protein
MNQLLFSCIFTLAIVLMFFMFGVWVLQLIRSVSVLKHGWQGVPPKKEPTHDVVMMTEPTQVNGKLEKDSKIPCTKSVPPVHTSMGAPGATVAKTVPEL